MSYILEALKKSDEERNRGATPGLQTVQTAVAHPSRKRTGWTYLLAFVLLLNAGLLAWWLRPWRTASQQTVQTNEQPQQQPVAGQTAKAAGNRQTEVAGQSQRPVKAAESRRSSAAREHRPARAQPEADLPASPAPETVGKDSAPAAPAAPAQQPAQPARPAAKGPAVGVREARNAPATEQTREKEPKPAPAVQAKPAAKAETVAPAPPGPVNEQQAKVTDEAPSIKPEPTKVEPKTTDAAASEQPLPTLKGLPAAMQKEISAITLSLLVYSNNPAERMVNINGQMTREGQEISPGLVLEQITQEGAVFSYKGTRFQKGAF